MDYAELLRLYFDRSNALQWLWTLYVLVIGGLLAISSFRRQANRLLTVLITVLYCCFAYKNLGAIRDLTWQREAILQTIRATPHDGSSTGSQQARSMIEPTLVTSPYPGVRNFHIACDVLTIAALWTMERRRRIAAKKGMSLESAAG